MYAECNLNIDEGKRDEYRCTKSTACLVKGEEAGEGEAKEKE